MIITGLIVVTSMKLNFQDVAAVPAGGTGNESHCCVHQYSSCEALADCMVGPEAYKLGYTCMGLSIQDRNIKYNG